MGPDERSQPGLAHLARLAAVLAFEVTAVVLLHWSGRYQFLRVPFGDLDRWLSDAPAEDVLAAAIRLVGLVLAYWVLTSTVLYTIGLLAGQPRLLRSISWAMLPGARPVLDGLVAISITGSSFSASLPVSADSVVAAAQPAEPQPAPRPTPPDAISAKLAIYPQSTPLPPPPPEARTHAVAGGESYLDIAMQHLGDTARWTEIWQANAVRIEAAGLALDARPEIGWALVLPEEAAQPLQAPSPPPAASAAGLGGEAVTVQLGDAVPDLRYTPQVADTERRQQADPSPAPPVVIAEAEVTAQPGDSMWRLAEQHMSAALDRSATPAETAPYWLRMIEANRDRFVDRSSPDLIYPGQAFVLPALTRRPADGAGPAPHEPSPQATEPPPGEPTAESPTDGRVPPAPDAPATPSTSSHFPPTTTTAPASADADSSPPATTTTRPACPNSDTVASRTDDPEADDTGAQVPMLVGAGVTSVALAVGITRAIRRRRRRRNFHAPSTTWATGGDEDLHRQLLLDADSDLADMLARCLDSLAVHLGKAGHTCRPMIVQHDADHLDVLLDRATLPAVAGWRAQANGEVWSFDATDSAIDDVEPGRVMAAPLLVTLGEPDASGQLYLDLEAAQVVTLAGDLEVACDLAGTLVTELAHSPFTDNAQIVVVGDLGSGRHADFDRVIVVDDWTDVAANLMAWTEQSRQTLAAHGWPNSLVARGHDPDNEALASLVVVAAEPPEDPALLSLVQAGPTVTAVVTIGDVVADTAMATISNAPPGTMIIDCQADELSLPQLGLTCRPQVLSPDRVDAVAELLDIAESPGDEERQESEVISAHPDIPVGSNGESDPAEPYRDPPYEILVRFLGEISVDGGKHRLTAKQTSLVAFVALHGSVSVDRAADAVWVVPSAVSDRKRLSNLMTKCRSAVGPQHLPVVQDDHYAIGPDVATDIDLFERRIKAAVAMPPDRAVETLRGALELVRGPIFYYSDKERESFTWVDLGNWVTHWELHITTAACRATELYLDLGRTKDAVEITDCMHRVVPTSPELTEALMHSHAAAGNLHLVQRVFQAHAAALEKLGLDTVAASTLALYEELRRRRES